MDELYKPSGIKPKVNAIVRELENIDEDITKLTLDSDRYSELMDQVISTDKEIVESKSRLEFLQRKSLRLDSMLEVFGEWTELQSVEGRLSEKKEHIGFSEQSLGELQNRLENISAKEKEVRLSEESLEEAKFDADSIKSDFKINDDEDIILKINEQKSSILKSISDLPERKSEMDSENESVEKRLSNLGKGWDAERLLTTDLCSLPVSEAIGHSLEKISEVKRNISIVKNNYATSKEESFNANNLLMEREESLKSSILPKYTKEDLDRRIILLKKINEIYRAYKSVSSLR